MLLSVTYEYMILGNKSTYFARAKSVVISIEQWNRSQIAKMLQWINRAGYITVFNGQLRFLLYAAEKFQNRRWCIALHIRVVFYSLLDISCINSKKILPRLKKLRYWKMCRFQRISHWIFMLRTSKASDFFIFTPPINMMQYYCCTNVSINNVRLNVLDCKMTR